MSFAAYAVAIKLNLVDGLSPAMMAISRHIRDTHGHVTDLEKRLASIQTLFKSGALMTGAGVGLAFAMKAATNEAVRFEQQLNKIKALNLGTAVTGQLTSLAEKMSNSTKGTSQTEALRLVTETQAITGNAAHTMELAPYLAKMRFGMETYMSGNGKGEGHGATAERQFADIVKVMEMRGLMRNFSEDSMHRMGDLFVKNFIASGGMVKPSDFLNMMKTGGVATKSVGEDFMFALGHIMQEKGGHRAGTQIMSAYQNLVMGRTTQQVAEKLVDLHLLGKNGVHYGKTGHVTKLDPGALKAVEMFIDNPLNYEESYILPALKAKGVDLSNTNKTLMALSGVTSNRLAGDLLAGMYLEKSQIANYVAQAKNVKGVEGLYEQSANSTIGKQVDLQAKLLNLEKTFGEAVLPLLIKAYETMIPLVKQFNDYLEKNPGALKDVVYGLGALAGSLMISGQLMMVASGFKAVGLAIDVLASAGGIPKLLGALGAGGAASSLGVIGKLGAVGAAAAGGFAIGTGINWGINQIVQWATNGKNSSLGDWGYDKLHPEDDGAPQTVRPNTGAVTKYINNTIVMPDGRVLANVVTQQQVKQAERPMTGRMGFDASMSYSQVAQGR